MPLLGPPRARGLHHGPPIGPPALQFIRPTVARALYTIRGITKDNTGAVLGGVTVDLFFATGDKQRADSVVSDAVTGEYCFESGDNVGTYFTRTYKDGATPVGGTSLDTLRFT